MQKSIKLDVRIDIKPEGVSTYVYSAYSAESEFCEKVREALRRLAIDHFANLESKPPDEPGVLV